MPPRQRRAHRYVHARRTGPDDRPQNTPAILAEALSQILRRKDTDKTGLTGHYDFDLSWTPDENEIRAAGDTGQYPIDPFGPSMFTALQEQLGLKLETIKGSVKMLTIERVERPSED